LHTGSLFELQSNEREFLWRVADTKTLLNGTAAPPIWNFNIACAA
jgi:hypothetical protein